MHLRSYMIGNTIRVRIFPMFVVAGGAAVVPLPYFIYFSLFSWVNNLTPTIMNDRLRG